jgi:phospholipid/cholesterol/gamma-HCH transport system substrate-binding protein
MRSFRERRPMIVGALSVLLIAAGVAFAFSVNKFPALKGVYHVSADLKDAAGLIPGNQVQVAGVKVGQVSDITLTPDAARITLEIRRDIRIPEETRVEVKLRTLLGQKFVSLEMPRAFLEASSGGGDPSDATAGFLEDGDVIPKSQTSIPYEIYQAANEGTDVLERIDKHALRSLLNVTANTVGASKEELRSALVGVNRVGGVLGKNSDQVAELLRNANQLSGILAAKDQDISGVLTHSAEVLGVLADRRATIHSLLGATNDLARNLGLLIQAVRGDVATGTRDLNSLLTVVRGELDTIDDVLGQLGLSQRLLAQSGNFGRFLEVNVCAVTTEDTCVPEGSPEEPGFPIKGTQPQGPVAHGGPQ